MTNGQKIEPIDWSMESHAGCVRCSDHKSIARKDDESIRCCQSQCIPEKPKTSFADKHAPGCPQFRRSSEEERQIEIASCYDKFALAKRLHAENLQHQPLPDRVDDSIFKKGHRTCSASYERIATRQNRTYIRKGTGDYVFAPALGCKEPKTRMDLAICWETPVDPVYEPRKSTHIDGSEGGLAPAVFTMIQHTPAPKSRELLAIQSTKGKNECTCAKRQEDSKRDSCCPNYFRNELGDGPSRGEKLSRSMLRVTERKCTACDGGKSEAAFERKKDPRLIRSAVDIALGLEHGGRTGDGKEPCKGKRLPARLTVPRPRTPFARRTFCIDTLAPPFSVIDGCRDTDYPEHWRLMTVHQQSYKHPQHRKTAFDYKMRIIS